MRLAILSRYALADQYDLAAEFPETLRILGQQHEVLHLSLRGPQPVPPAPPGVRIEEIPLTIRRDDQGDKTLKSLLMYLLFPWICWRLRRHRPDGIFLTEVLPLYGLALKWCTRARIAVPCGDRHVYNLLGKRGWTKPLVAVAEGLERLETSRMDGIFTRGTTILRRITGHGFPMERVRIVRDVPDERVFSARDESALRARCGFTPDDIVIHYHGVMHKGKGLDMLIRWVAELRSEEPRLALLMVGAGPEEKPLRELAARCGLGERAHFTGWLNDLKGVGDYCNASDICVPMRTGDEDNVDMIPGALIHSLACGKIVLIPGLPGMQEMVTDGVNGFVFRPDDGDDFKRVLRRVIASRSDWPRIQQAALRYTREHFSVASAGRAYADAIAFFAAPR